MQENMFGEETEAVRKSWKQVTATYLGKRYGQEGDTEANSVFRIYSITFIALRTIFKAFLCQRQKSLASRSITSQPILLQNTLINMQPSLTVSQSKHYNILVLQRKQTFLVRNLSSGASGNLKDVLIY